MSKKFKIFTVLLSVILLFGITTNYSDAASNSTSKIIQNLKKQVKQLTASNKDKDEEITKLESQVSSQISENRKLQKTNEETNNTLREIELKNVNTLNAKLSILLRNALTNQSLLYTSNPYRPDANIKEPKLIDITIDSQIFYFDNMEQYVTKQELKDKVISLLRGYNYPNIKVNSVTIQLPSGDLVVPTTL